MSKSPAFPALGLFVTGTDTEVGKTYVSALLAESLVAAGHRVGVYKPAASGGALVDGRCVCDDATILWEAARRPATVHEVCPQMFLAPLAPNVAARAESRSVDSALLTSGLRFWRDQCDLVIVEGAGGLMSPLAEGRNVADIAIEIGYPVIVVTANRLGTINQTLQTLITARHYGSGLKVAGVVVNDVNASDDPSMESNPAALRKTCDVPVLAHLAHGQASWPTDVDGAGWFGPSAALGD